MTPDSTPNDVFPILLGSGRSGTTLFRNILDSHPDLCVTHEAHFIAPLATRRGRYEAPSGFDVTAFVDDLYDNPNFIRQGLDRGVVADALRSASVAGYADAVRVVFSVHATAEGKTLYGDKTPGYVTQIPQLAALFPEAKFLHIVRDGRDVALAYLDRREWGPSTMADAALYWSSRVSRGREAGEALADGRYQEFRYEDMVDDPRRAALDLCGFIGIEFHEAMLDHHLRAGSLIAGNKTPDAFTNLAKPVTKGLRDWRTQMAPDDVVLFEAIAGETLGDFGYETVGVQPDLATRAKVSIARTRWQAKRVSARVGPMIRRRSS